MKLREMAVSKQDAVAGGMKEQRDMDRDRINYLTILSAEMFSKEIEMWVRSQGWTCGYSVETIKKENFL